MGLTFLNGLFALALGAVSVPILIHLLNRRRASRQVFSSLQFLEEVSRRQRRRVRLRQWLLLALRCLIILLVVLAMMRPAIRSAAPGGAGSTTAVVVFDNSFSMAAATETSSHLETARERLGHMSGLFGQGDRLQLLWPHRTPDTAFDAPVRDFGRVEAAAAQAPVSYTPTAAGPALTEAIRIAEGSPNLNREIYIVSDFQEADWSDEVELPEIPDWARVYLVPVAAGGLPNVAVATASFVKASVRSGSSGAVRVTLANFSDTPLQGYPVRVFSDDEVVAEGGMQVPVDDLATIDLPLTRMVDPTRALQVQIAEDALALDDVAWVTLGDRQAIRVLVVHGGGSEAATDEPYLRLALDPPGSAGERLFTVDEIPLRDLPVQADLDYDVFVLNNVERLSDGVISRLRLAHRDGAGVFFVLGDRVDLRYYNTHILDDFVNVTLDDPASSNGSFFTLRPDVPGHPVFDGFRVGFGEEVTTARFLKLVRSRVGSGARILASFGNHPALIEGERVLLFTSSFDLRWGNFPTGGSFLPFIHQAILTLASTAVESRQFRAGFPITLDLPLDDVGGEVMCFAPDGGELPVQEQVRAGRVEIRTEAAPEPGVYRFTSAGDVLRQVPVHLDPYEGRLRYLNPETLSRRLGERVRVLKAEDPVTERVREDRVGREIWRELLLAALILMLVETVVGRVKLA